MIDIDRLYFEWLLRRLESDEEDSALGLPELCWALYHALFGRRVGLDINRAENGLALRKEFLAEYSELDIDPSSSNRLLLDSECTWLEMLIRLSEDLDYLYEGSPRARFIEICRNMGFAIILLSDKPLSDWDLAKIDQVLNRVDNNDIGYDGRGGLFPLSRAGHLDQREVEIWAQAGTYFGEKLEEI